MEKLKDEIQMDSDHDVSAIPISKISEKFDIKNGDVIYIFQHPSTEKGRSVYMSSSLCNVAGG